MYNKLVRLINHIKRYRCMVCGAIFSNNNPITFNNLSFTRTTFVSILDRLNTCKSIHVSLAKSFSVTTLRIIEILDSFVITKRQNIQDKFHFLKYSKYKYPAMLIYLKNNLIVNISESRTHEVMTSYFFVLI